MRYVRRGKQNSDSAGSCVPSLVSLQTVEALVIEVRSSLLEMKTIKWNCSTMIINGFNYMNYVDLLPPLFLSLPPHF